MGLMADSGVYFTIDLTLHSRDGVDPSRLVDLKETFGLPCHRCVGRDENRHNGASGLRH